MGRKRILTAALFLITLYASHSLFGRGVPYVIDGTTLVTYYGKTANVKIPASVKVIGDRAFFGNVTLTNLTIPAGVTMIGESAFENCTSFNSVSIPASVTSIGSNAFQSCTSLTSVSIPSGVDSIGSQAFYWCNNLRTVTISRRTTIGNNAFPVSARITYSD